MVEDVRSTITPTTSTNTSKPEAKPREPQIAIIGAGIAGLYCGYRIGKKNQGLPADKQKDFWIFEESEHLGGRIWSTRILADGTIVPDGALVERDENSGYKDKQGPVQKEGRYREFCAEFGPMRVELDLQHCLNNLLLELGFEKEKDFEKFPPYQSPTSEHDPKYELKGDEREQETPLDLLRLAVARIIGRLICRYTDDDLLLARKAGVEHEPPTTPKEHVEGICLLRRKLDEGVDALSRATATRQPDWKIFFSEWTKTLDEPDYQRLRQYAAFDDNTTYDDDANTKEGVALWNMGFWNLLSEVLSHHAVLKIRDLGTFYHLIPENPNAAEWLIFWLRAFRTSEQLVGIRGGMQRITEALAKEIDSNPGPDGESRIKSSRKLVRIQGENGKIKLTFQNVTTGADEEWRADHVILALPRGPLEELAKLNERVLCSKLLEDIKAVFGFPLLKFFLVVKERWWNQDSAMTNRYATQIPTRELHYHASPMAGSKKGLVLVYTDRPAAGFWSNYIQHDVLKNSVSCIPSGIQTQPEKTPTQNVRLINKALQYLKEHGVTLEPDDVQFYGIRDWGREPYRGAAHSWYPERQSWAILKRLTAFALGKSYPGDNPKTRVLHVCGEAYSDYQAFIEGALRSVEHVLHTVYPDIFPDTPSSWLCAEECPLHKDPAGTD